MCRKPVKLQYSIRNDCLIHNGWLYLGMMLTISKKLILAFLGLTLVVLISTLGLARWSFEQGFLDYVNALEETRLRLLASDLSQEYLGAGNSWSTTDRTTFRGDIMGAFGGEPRRAEPGGYPATARRHVAAP